MKKITLEDVVLEMETVFYESNKRRNLHWLIQHYLRNCRRVKQQKAIFEHLSSLLETVLLNEALNPNFFSTVPKSVSV